MTPILETNEAFLTRDEKLFVRVVDVFPARFSLRVVLGRVVALAFLGGFVGFLVVAGWAQ
jgi:hypothetical protein